MDDESESIHYELDLPNACIFTEDVGDWSKSTMDNNDSFGAYFR